MRITGTPSLTLGLTLGMTGLLLLASGRSAEPQATPGTPAPAPAPPAAPAPAPTPVAPKSRPGAVVVETREIKAKVDAVDPATRLVTLTGPKGNTVTVKAGPEVRNFDQIHVGDVLTLRYLESIAVFVRKPGDPPSATESQTVQVAAKGQKPHATIVETKEVTATVEAIDHAKRTVTLKGPEGNSRTIKVDPAVKRLHEVKKGDQVVARYTEAIAITVKTPAASAPAAPAPPAKTKTTP